VHADSRGGGAWVGKEQPMSGGGELADELRWGAGWADVAFRWGDAGGWGRGRRVPGPVEQAGCQGGRAAGRSGERGTVAGGQSGAEASRASGA
jgi:hypothetical protein